MSDDFPLGSTLDFKFTTRAFATGIPTTLAGTPVISAYKDNSVTQITAGITLTTDFDGLAGLNNVRVEATGPNGFASGESYALVITAGTVGGVSVVGEVVKEFTIERQSADVRAWEGNAAAVKVGAGSGLPQMDVTAWQDTPLPAGANMIEDDGSTNPRWTAKALEQAPRGGGGYIDADYKWSDSTSATDPGEGEMKGNNATQASITALYVNEVSQQQFNIAAILDAIRTNDTFTVAVSDDGSSFFQGRFTGPGTDNGGWWTLPCVVTDTGSTVDSGKEVRFGLFMRPSNLSETDVDELRHRLGLSGNKNDPGVVTASLWSVNASPLIEDSSGLRYTQKALEQGPVATGFAVPGDQMNLADGAISSAKYAAGAITNAAIAAGALNGKGDWNIGKTGYDLNADQSGVTIGTVTTNSDMRGTDGALTSVSAIWSEPQAGYTTPGTFGFFLDAQVSTRSTFDETAAMTEDYAANGASFNLIQALYAIWAAVGPYDIVSTTLTTRKLNGTDPAMTFTLNDANNPTSRVRNT